MAEDSEIGWTDNTGNFWWGCVEVHEGCDNCYARIWDNRYNGDHWGIDKPRRAIKSIWGDLIRWQRQAKEQNKILKVFVGSMMDIFEKPMPIVDVKGNPIYGKLGELAYISSSNKTNGFDDITTDDLRQIFFNQISKGHYPNLLFQFLTKRPSSINKYIPDPWKNKAPQNIIFGTSPVNQATADNLIPHLLKVKGKRFLSIEPQLGHIDLRWRYAGMRHPLDGIDWVIVGGESGHHKREFNPDWAREIRDVCKEYDVPFFMKQWDKIKEIPEDLMIREFPEITLPQAA